MAATPVTKFEANPPKSRTFARQDELPKLPVPPLEDTPQDAIINALPRFHPTKSRPALLAQEPHHLEPPLIGENSSEPDEDTSMWEHAAKVPVKLEACGLSE